MTRKVSDAKNSGPNVDRRKFLSGVAVAGAAGAMTPQPANATVAAGATTARVASALPPTTQTIAAETGIPQADMPRIGGIAGSDYMVDVIKTLDIKYLPANCASSYRAIHESLINYGGNKMPEFLTCSHEESAVGMAHGYVKIDGKPIAFSRHGNVGCNTLQWPSTTPGATASRLSSWAAMTLTPPTGGRACRRFIARRTLTRLCATSPNGTTRGVVAALRAVVRARLQDRDDPALRPSHDLTRRWPPAGADPRQRREALYSEVHSNLATAG